MADFVPTVTYRRQIVLLSDVLYSAYRKARVLKHPGQGISNSESAEGVQLINSMLDGMKIEALFAICFRRSIHNVLSGQSVYGVAQDQDFNIERPEHIRRASRLEGTAPNTTEIPLDIIITYERWQQVVTKVTTGNLPLALYYQATAPIGTATFWPVPSSDSQIALYTPQTLSEFSTPDDAVEVPDGYREMLEYNLAVKVHHNYPDHQMDPMVTTLAAAYKDRVKMSQRKPMFIDSDPAARQERRRDWPWGGNPRAWTPY